MQNKLVMGSLRLVRRVCLPLGELKDNVVVAIKLGSPVRQIFRWAGGGKTQLRNMTSM